MAKTTQTRKRSPKPIPAMLEGAFATELENRIAVFNNTLAREGRLTSDPGYEMLSSIKKELVSLGVVTFSRTAVAAPSASAEEEAPAPKRRRRKATKEEPATVVAAREIDASEIEALQVEGSVTDSAPYGADAEGHPLAPYGVKKNGQPMRRRGRAAPVQTAPEAGSTGQEQEQEDDATAHLPPATEHSAAPVTAEASSEEDTTEEDTTEEDTTEEEEEEEDEDFDALLADLDD